MAESFVQLPADDDGKQLRMESVDVGGDTRYQQVATLAGSDGELVDASNANGLEVDVTRVQGTVAVSAASLPLPSGASTSAAQTTGNNSLASIDGKITAVNTGAVVVASSALPSGAATSANQSTGNTSLSSLETKAGAVDETAPATDTASSGLNGRLQRIAQRLTSLLALLPSTIGQKNKAGSLSVTLASDQDTVPVSGTFFQATQPVSGTVAVSGTTTVSGTVTANAGSGVYDVTPTSPVATEYLPVRLTDGSDFYEASGGPGGSGTEYTEGDTDASITGTAILMEVGSDTLQPVQGTVADGLLVNLGGNNDVTVTGSVTANAGTNLNTSALALEAGNLASIKTAVETLDNAIAGSEMQVDVVAALPAGTNNIGDVDVLTLPALPAGNNNIGDVDIASIAAGDNNIGNVDVVTMPNVTLAAGTNTNEVVGDAAHDAAVAGNPLLLGFEAKDQDGSALPNAVAAEGRVVRGAASLSGVQYVMPVNEDGSAVATINAAQSGSWNVGTVTTVTAVTAISNALPAGTNAIGKLAANSGVDIGDVDVTSLPASTNTLEVVGDVAHNVAAAGNPVLIAASVETIADSAPDNRVTTDARASRLSVTDGALFVIPAGPQQWSYHSDGSSALTDATVHSAPGSGLSLYVTSIVFSTGAATACNIFFEEGSTKVLGPWYLEAVAGRGLAVHFGTPKKITANTALTVTTSAAIAQAVDVTGFIAPG